MDKQTDLISRLQDEADLCRNEGASDIAALLDEAVKALRSVAFAFPPNSAGLTQCDMHDDESN